jgi:beta-phosphoglucomutase-like phosphatase (HAD superfamily)
MPIQAIVFDFDGVLADSEMLHLLAPAGATISNEQYVERYLGFDDEGVFEQIAIDYKLMLGDEEIEMLIAEKARRFEALVSSGGVMYETAAACVRRLGATWPLGIASGARRDEIELMLRGAGLLDAFAFIVAAGDTDRGKPAPDPYRRAAELHGAPPTACVAIEDSHAGLESARTAGLRTIAITTTYPRATLVADALVDSLDEISDEFVRRLETRA